MRYYSKTTGCTYLDGIHAGQMPDDAVPMAEVLYQEVIGNPDPGKVRSHDAAGLPILIDPPPATRGQVIAAAVSSVQAHLDDAAQSLGYDDIKTAVTYADEPAVPKFQADGQALRAWRSLVWAQAYATLDAVEAGKREQPTIEQFIAELPEFVLAYD